MVFIKKNLSFTVTQAERGTVSRIIVQSGSGPGTIERERESVLNNWFMLSSSTSGTSQRFRRIVWFLGYVASSLTHFRCLYFQEGACDKYGCVVQ